MLLYSIPVFVTGSASELETRCRWASQIMYRWLLVWGRLGVESEADVAMETIFCYRVMG